MRNTWARPYIVLQATPTSAKEGKGPVNCAYKPCPIALYSVAQLHYTIFSHDTLHHRLSNNNGAENGDRELGATIGVVKLLPTILLSEPTHIATGIQECIIWIWLCNLANCILVGHDLYAQFIGLFPSFAEVGLACETWVIASWFPTNQLFWLLLRGSHFSNQDSKS